MQTAVLDAAAALVAERGLTGVSMSEVAKRTGLGRATLYKYFPDVDSILVAWHQRQVGEHLRQLADTWERTASLETVLGAYALICYEHPSSDAAASLHRGQHVAHAQAHLIDFIAQLLVDVRDDVPPKELAAYCIHALTAASAAPSKAAVRRLVAMTMAGITARPD
ncbi:TetR/AcrR family transcriptional regulator [Kribbella sp. NPDC055071]